MFSKEVDYTITDESLNNVVNSLGSDFESNKKVHSNNVALPNSNIQDFILYKYCLEHGIDVSNFKNTINSREYVPAIEFEELSNEIAASMEGDYMNDNKYLEIYLEKIDEDRRRLQTEFKEREERITKQTENSEIRMNIKLDKIENLILDQNNKIDNLKDEVKNQLSEDKKYRHANNIAIALGVIATVLAMVGIYYATVSTITDIIGMIK